MKPSQIYTGVTKTQMREYFKTLISATNGHWRLYEKPAKVTAFRIPQRDELFIAGVEEYERSVTSPGRALTVFINHEGWDAAGPRFIVEVKKK